MPKCPNCGGRVDLTKDGDWGHCADCNNIIEIKKDDKEQDTPKESGSSSEVKR